MHVGVCWVCAMCVLRAASVGGCFVIDLMCCPRCRLALVAKQWLQANVLAIDTNLLLLPLTLSLSNAHGRLLTLELKLNVAKLLSGTCTSAPAAAHPLPSLARTRPAARDVLDKSTLPARAGFGLPSDKVIYSCSNQLYKYDPDTFNTWCNILRRVPDSVLWLLRFPPYGEANVRGCKR